MATPQAKLQKRNTPARPKPRPLTGRSGLLGLGIREARIEKEIKVKGLLDSDHKALVKSLATWRRRSEESDYELVCLYVAASRQPKLWKEFGCKDVDSFFLLFDIPDGDTILKWKSLAELFDKETFILIGTDRLGAMERTRLRAQIDILGREDMERAKADYREIFRRYNEANREYEHRAFKNTWEAYFKEAYRAEPVAPPTMPEVEEAAPEKPQSKVRETVARYPRSAPVPWEQQTEPKAETTTTRVPIKCRGCVGLKKENDDLRAEKAALQARDAAWAARNAQLEAIIAKKLGPKAVPPLPAALKQAQAA